MGGTGDGQLLECEGSVLPNTPHSTLLAFWKQLWPSLQVREYSVSFRYLGFGLLQDQERHSISLLKTDMNHLLLAALPTEALPRFFKSI